MNINFTCFFLMWLSESKNSSMAHIVLYWFWTELTQGLHLVFEWVLCTSPHPSTSYVCKHAATNGELPLLGLESTTNSLLSCSPRVLACMSWRVRQGVGPHSMKRGSLEPGMEREAGGSQESTGLGREAYAGSRCSHRQGS